MIDFHKIPLKDDKEEARLAVVILAEAAGLMAHVSGVHDPSKVDQLKAEIQQNYSVLFKGWQSSFPLDQQDIEIIANIVMRLHNFQLTAGPDRDEIDLSVLRNQIDNLLRLAIYRGGQNAAGGGIALLDTLDACQQRRLRPD